MTNREPGSLGLQREQGIEAPDASPGMRSGASPVPRCRDARMLNGAVWRQAWGDQRLLWLAMAALSSASSSARSGSNAAKRCANMDLPEPGGPTMRSEWPPAAAISSTRFTPA